jgi:transcriptional regulator with XRE-family HTH domain
MKTETLPQMLKRLREDRRISQRQLADTAGVDSSLVNRVEAGRDARGSTWIKLFEALGYRLTFDAVEVSEDAADLLADEAYERRERRDAGLRVGKRRW